MGYGGMELFDGRLHRIHILPDRIGELQGGLPSSERHPATRVIFAKLVGTVGDSPGGIGYFPHPARSKLGCRRDLDLVHPGQMEQCRKAALNLINGLSQRLALSVQKTRDPVESISVFNKIFH